MTSSENCSVYLGGIAQNCSGIFKNFIAESSCIYHICLEDDMRQAFKRFGTIVDIRHFKPQGYAFLKFDSKVFDLS
jgi:RNA recognition motif-containing protein